MSNVNITAGDTHIVPIDAVTPYPGNARQGSDTTIDTSLATHGQYRPCIVQRSTGHIIAGNNLHRRMQHAGADSIAVQYLDVDDDQARRINLVDNKSNDDATYDNRLLAELLHELPSLDGTGYNLGELNELETKLDDPAPGDADTDTMPGQSYGVYVVCDTETHQAEVLDRLASWGYRVRAV